MAYSLKTKSFFLEKETLYIILAFSVILISAIAVFSFLFDVSKLVFIWIVSFLGFFIVRRTDSWKIGLEFFYLLTFVLSYAVGLFFSLSVVYLTLISVLKIRKDELNGVFIHAMVLTGTALTARYLLGLYGPYVREAQFIFLTMLTIIIWLFVDFFIALRIAPVPWPKLLITHILNITVNYFLVTLIGYKLLQYLLFI